MTKQQKDTIGPENFSDDIKPLLDLLHGAGIKHLVRQSPGSVAGMPFLTGRFQILVPANQDADTNPGDLAEVDRVAIVRGFTSQGEYELTGAGIFMAERYADPKEALDAIRKRIL